MAHFPDDSFASVAAVSTTDGAPYRLTVSNVAATYTNLPAGRYIVALDGPAFVILRTGGVAAAPASAAQAAGNATGVQSGWTYNHRATADLSAITSAGSGALWLLPVPGPG